MTQVQLYDRHSELIDKKFLKGLTPYEELELDVIRDKIKRLEALYYENIIENLEKTKSKYENQNRKAT